MPHEFDGGLVHWHEPPGLMPAGERQFRRPDLAYDRLMAEDAVPVHRAAIVDLSEKLEFAPWRRLGGQGCYLQLFGTEGAIGQSVIEIEAGAATRAERHLCDEIVLVLEGEGTTELRAPQAGAAGERVVFEWQTHSLFAITRNALHRFVNAGSKPARLLCLNSLPAILNLLGEPDLVFANSAPVLFDEEAGHAFEDIEPDPVQGLALCRTTLVPDVVGCDLPLDNRHSPSHRKLQLAMTGPGLAIAIGEHRPGRYGRARLAAPGEVSVCLRGAGYRMLWPEEVGPTPFETGQAAHITRIKQSPGVITGFPEGGGRWFVQDFTLSQGPLRHLHVQHPDRPAGPPGEALPDPLTTDFDRGGLIIPYWREDVVLRRAFASELEARKLPNRMREQDYQADGDE